MEIQKILSRIEKHYENYMYGNVSKHMFIKFIECEINTIHYHIATNGADISDLLNIASTMVFIGKSLAKPKFPKGGVEMINSMSNEIFPAPSEPVIYPNDRKANIRFYEKNKP